MIRKAECNLLLIEETTGELKERIRRGESYNVRSRKQTLLDENYSPRQKVFYGRFIKVMLHDDALEDYFKDSLKVYYVINKLKNRAEFNSNLIKKNGKKYTITEMAKDFGVSRQMMHRYINKLRESNLIADILINNEKFLAINPKYFLNGDELPEKIIKLFEDKELPIKVED